MSFKLSRRSFLAGSMATALVGCQAATVRTPREEVAHFPIIDNHSHLLPTYMTPRLGTTPDDLIAAMDAAGIQRMVVVGFGTEVPDLPKRYPGRFVAAYVMHNFRWRQDPRFAFIVPQDQQVGDGTDPKEVEAISAEFETALGTGQYNAIAEITTIALPIRAQAVGTDGRSLPGANLPPDSPLVLRLMELAAKFDLPINLHCESTATDRMIRAVAARPKTRIIWAHTGSYLSPRSIADLLHNYPNLDFDLSAKNAIYEQRSGSFLQFGSLNEDWRQLFEAFPDRFYFGVDFLTKSQLGYAKRIGQDARAVFSQLTPTTARKIAFENTIQSYRLAS